MAKKTDDDVAFIEALAKILRDNEMTELEVERASAGERELKIRLARKSDGTSAPGAPALAPPPAPSTPPASVAPAPPAPPEDPAQHPGAVPSPMVGTVYLSPEPGAAPFVRPGDEVAEGATILIIEAMKTMNQIPAPASGVVRRVLVDDKQAVEFGAPLVIIE